MHSELKEAFDQVHAAEELKDKTYDFVKTEMQKVDDQIVSQGRKQRQKWRKQTFVLAGFASFFLVLFSLCYYYLPVYAISIDTAASSSVELSVNRMERVISVEAYDTKKMEKQDKLINMNCKKAVQMILEKEPEKEETVITVISNDQEQNRQVLESFCTEHSEKRKVIYKEGKSKNLREAHDLGLSCGKYRAYLELHKVDQTIKVEEIQTLSAGEIYKKAEEISCHQKEPERKQKGKHGKENGECHDRGSSHVK